MARYNMNTTRRGARFGAYAGFKSAVRGQTSTPSVAQHLTRNSRRPSGKQTELISAPNAGYIGDTLAP